MAKKAANTAETLNLRCPTRRRPRKRSSSHVQKGLLIMPDPSPPPSRLSTLIAPAASAAPALQVGVVVIAALYLALTAFAIAMAPAGDSSRTEMLRTLLWSGAEASGPGARRCFSPASTTRAFPSVSFLGLHSKPQRFWLHPFAVHWIIP